MPSREDFWAAVGELAQIIRQNVADGETSATFSFDLSRLEETVQIACRQDLNTVAGTLNHLSRRLETPAAANT